MSDPVDPPDPDPDPDDPAGRAGPADPADPGGRGEGADAGRPTPSPGGWPAPGDDLPTEGPGSLATMGQRFTGLFVDIVPFQVGLLIAAQAMRGGEADVVLPWWLVPVVTIDFLVYQVTLLARRGQTLGCQIARIRVARYTDGRRPLLDQAVVRCAVPALAGSVLVPLGLADVSNLLELGVYLTAYLDPQLRAVHDKLAGTIVVRTA